MFCNSYYVDSKLLMIHRPWDRTYVTMGESSGKYYLHIFITFYLFIL